MNGFEQMAEGANHEPMSVHADHFLTNNGYNSTAYSKGEFFLDQLGYVIGDSALHEGLLRYYAACRFKHPEPIDVQRSMEKQTGLQLDWYFDEWINTTRKIDYSVSGVMQRNDSTFITLERKGEMLMPVDVAVTDNKGGEQLFHIPLSLMLGAKPDAAHEFTVLPAWQWTDPSYSFGLPVIMGAIDRITIDPLMRMADMDRTNDQLILAPGTQGVINH